MSARRKPQPWPAETVERWPVTRPKPNPKNPRVHSAAQVQHLAKLIREYGWTMPILCDERDNVLAGHGRMLAALELGAVEVPVIVARGWSAAQKRAYAIADNQAALMSSWDVELLRGELGDLRAKGLNLELAGFTRDGLKGVFPQAEGQRAASESAPQFQIVVTCESEDQQRELLDTWSGDGLKCRALIG
jgi:hypothetical protein